MRRLSLVLIATSILLLGGAIYLARTIGEATGGWNGRVQMNVFLREDATTDQTRRLQTSLAGMPEVDRVFYVSKEEAYNEYNEMFKDSPTLTENVSPSVMPANFRIKLEDPTKVEEVKTRIEGRPGVDEVTFGGDAVLKVLRMTEFIRTAVMFLAVLMIGGGMFLLARTQKPSFART